MAAGEIMITVGAIAIIAAAVGGQVKGGGWEIPSLKSGRRQILLGAIGVVFVAVGIAVVIGFNPFRGRAQMTASIQEGVVVFRSSNRDDRFRRGGNSGYLILTSHIQVRNRPHSAGPITWAETEATLEIDGRRIRFRPYEILTGRQTWDHWLGDQTEKVGGITLKPGENADKTIIFVPLKTSGPDALSWQDFVNHILAGGDRPHFVIRVHVDRGGASTEVLEPSCELETNEQKAFVESQFAEGAELQMPGLSVGCVDQGGGR